MRTHKEKLDFIVENEGDCDWPCWSCPLHSPNSECSDKNALSEAKNRLEKGYYGDSGLGSLLAGMFR